MIRKQKQLIDIIKDSKVLYNLDPILVGDDFPGGGTGGGGGGTTSGNIVPSLSISPNTNQSIAIGTTLCFTASGNVSFPQESEQTANFNGGCSSTSSGTWVKNCGTNGNFDSEAFDTRSIYVKRPFQITGRNSVFNTPGVPINNTHLLMGVKTTGGYTFFWEVFRYCGALPTCNPKWIGSIKMSFPNGNQTTLATGYVEFNQQFRLRSDGSRISWDYTTENNWVYNRYYIDIPNDCGNFQFIINGLFLGNTWTNLKTLRGSYQATPADDDFIWTSNCIDSLVITGNKACYTPVTPGHCRICVSTIDLEPKCVSVVSAPLTLTPTTTECRTCGQNDDDCENIPEPTLPVVTLESTSPGTLNVNWTEAISFTNGLYYQIDVNGDIETTLDTNIILLGLEEAEYTISVRAIDACGSSEWTEPQTIEISSELITLDSVEDFEINEIGEGSQTDLDNYEATWSVVPPISSPITYEIWIGNPQFYKIFETTDLNLNLGELSKGLMFSIRAKDEDNNYSLFSDFVEVN